VLNLEPLEFAEDKKQGDGGEDEDAAYPLGSVRRIFKGKALEVHAVDAGDGQGGNRNGTEDGEDLHDFVGAVGDGREIDVEGVVEEVALGFDGVKQPGDVVVGVADVGLVIGVDDGVGIALEVERGVACVDENAAEVDEFALDGEDGLENLRGGVVEDLVFELVDAVVEVVDGRKVEIDDGVEDEREEMGGLVVAAIATGAGEGLLGGGTGGIGDGDEEVFAGEDVDGREGGHLFAGIVGVGDEAYGLEDGEGVAGPGVDFDPFVSAA
jgi:hypothetical protein